VGSFTEVWKWFVCMNSSVFVSYWAVDKITSELPLSACVIMAPLSFSLVFMFLIVLDLECVWGFVVVLEGVDVFRCHFSLYFTF
jgi:hypothetical protein